MRKAVTALLAASLGLTAVSARAQEIGSRQTREFLQASASFDQFEILAAHVAMFQSTKCEVRAFAVRMLQDHQRLAETMKNAAARSGLKPPEMVMSADQAQLLAALQGVRGKDFDSLYLEQQVLVHGSALVVEQMYAKSGVDVDLQHLAASAAPLISSHNEMAKWAESELRTS